MFFLLSFNSGFLNMDKSNIIQTLNVLFKFEIVLGPNKRIIKWLKLPFMSIDVSTVLHDRGEYCCNRLFLKILFNFSSPEKTRNKLTQTKMKEEKLEE